MHKVSCNSKNKGKSIKYRNIFAIIFEKSTQIDDNIQQKFFYINYKSKRNNCFFKKS